MENKVEIHLEYIINSSPRILFPFIHEPNALSQWFADDVNYKDGIYEFIWDDEMNRAKIVSIKENKSVRFKWLEDEPYYLDRKSTRLNSSHVKISYAVFCLKKKK